MSTCCWNGRRKPILWRRRPCQICGPRTSRIRCNFWTSLPRPRSGSTSAAAEGARSSNSTRSSGAIDPRPAMAPGMTVIDQIYQEDKAASPVGHPRILALANQKGGVGKTTTAINLGTALAAIGERVLIVDLDPQGNASTGLGIDRRNRSCSTYHVLIGEAPLRDAVVP